jgi:hypothetical protein
VGDQSGHGAPTTDRHPTASLARQRFVASGPRLPLWTVAARGMSQRDRYGLDCLVTVNVFERLVPPPRVLMVYVCVVIGWFVSHGNEIVAVPWIPS